MNAGEIQQQLQRDSLPVNPDTIRVLNDGTFTVEFSRALTIEEQAKFDALPTRLVEYNRQQAIDAEVQRRKNASLGYTPEQIAETLKAQVNMGIGGLLLLIQQLQGVQLSEAQLASVSKRLEYWHWVVAMDNEAAACKADPTRVPNFPPAPVL